MRQKQTTAVGYCRVSTEDQAETGYSLPTQRQAIEAYALKENIRLMDILEEDMSGLILERPGLSTIRNALATGQANALIVHAADRLSRDPLHAMIIRRELQEQYNELHIVTRGGKVDLDDVAALIMVGIEDQMSYAEIGKLVERFRRGKRGAVADGKVIISRNPPYGYRKHPAEKGRLVIDETEAKTVRLIYHLFTVNRLSLAEITRELTRLEIPTRGDTDAATPKVKPRCHWNKSTVASILRNETHAGVWHYGRSYINRRGERVKLSPDEWLGAEVPAIVSRPEYEQAQRLMEDNIYYSPRNTKNEYLMQKRLICGKCNRNLYATVKHNPGGGQRFYYHCSSKNGSVEAPNCGEPYYRIEAIDETAWQFVSRLLNDPDFMMDLINKALANQATDSQRLVTELAETRTKISQKEQALERLLADYYDAGETEPVEREFFNRTKSKFQAELKSLRNDEAELKTRMANVRQVDELVELYQVMSQHQEIAILGNEPFDLRRLWVEALHLTGTVYDGQRVRFDCVLNFSQDMDIAAIPSLQTGHNRHTLQVSYVMDLINQ